MRSSWIIPIVMLALSGCMGFVAASRHSALADAREVLRLLRSNDHAYQAALDREAESIAAARECLAERATPASLKAIAAEISIAQEHFQHVREIIAAAPVHSSVREEYLQPILQQVTKEERELGVLRDLLATGDPEDLLDARYRIDRHRRPENLFAPTIRDIRAAYGGVRQRLWHGRPLTA